MKTDTISKCYKGLDCKELASLAFIYCTKENKTEVERIMEAVPRATFSGPHVDYYRHANHYLIAATWWAIEHWKARYRHRLLLSAWGVFLESGNHEKANKARDDARTWESYLLALDRVLDGVGAQLGLDPDSVRRFAETERFYGVSDTVPDPEILGRLESGMRNLLNRMD
jgi:hypothetical protein